MVRTSAQRSTSSVIRTYAAVDRSSAERSFRQEREQAASRGWDPISQRWRTEGQEQVLTVVYEIRTGYLPAPVVAAGETAEAAGAAWDAGHVAIAEVARVGGSVPDRALAGRRVAADVAAGGWHLDSLGQRDVRRGSLAAHPLG